MCSSWGCMTAIFVPGVSGSCKHFECKGAVLFSVCTSDAIIYVELLHGRPSWGIYVYGTWQPWSSMLW